MGKGSYRNSMVIGLTHISCGHRNALRIKKTKVMKGFTAVKVNLGRLSPL